jgi:hypothetical protein
MLSQTVAAQMKLVNFTQDNRSLGAAKVASAAFLRGDERRLQAVCGRRYFHGAGLYVNSTRYDYCSDGE